jgi:signal transduction histidine kinase/CheY-like chemotaxis protein
MRVSLSRTLAISIAAASLLIALLSAIYQIRATYQAGLSAIHGNLALIEQVHIPALSADVWILDDDLINKQLSGIAHLPDMAYVCVTDDKGHVLRSIGIPAPQSATDDAASAVVRRSYPLMHAGPDAADAPKLIGRLEVEASLSNLRQSVRRQAGTIVLFELLRAAVLVSVIMLGMHWLVLKPLGEITNYTESLDVDGLARPLALAKPVLPHHDEMATLAQGLNRMRLTLQDEIARRQESEHQAHLLAIDKQASELANKSKQEFFAHMSHEIRTPMNAIMGLSQLALLQPLDERPKRYVQLVYDASKTLLAIVNDLLDFSKLEEGKMLLDSTPMSLPHLVDGVINLVAQQAAGKQLELIVDLSAELPRQVMGDPLRLHQVLLNLASNAIKFTEAGEVTLGIQVLARSARNVRLKFWVQDTGIGMPAEHVARLFTPYEQMDPAIARRFGGTGLGLALCDRLVKMMGSQIEARSEAGRGSVFAFELDCPLAPDASALSDASAPVAPFAGRRVLLIDDNASARAVQQRTLQSLGFVVDAVADGASGLAQSHASAANGAPYDLVLVDWLMPEMPGLDCAQQLTANAPVAPVLLLVPLFMQEQAEQQAHAQGGAAVSAIICKPITPHGLQQALQRLQPGTLG